MINDNVTRAFGVLATSRDVLLDYIVANATHFIDPCALPPILSIEMPCDEKIEYKTLADIPGEDVQCSCGDAAHWFIKYEDAGGA